MQGDGRRIVEQWNAHEIDVPSASEERFSWLQLHVNVAAMVEQGSAGLAETVLTFNVYYHTSSSTPRAWHRIVLPGIDNAF